ncbi:MAG: hypothetical protein JRJ43_02425 [Deltaproteobacteria bacterium]|nr:hypothetical protein [Deltaproteobacteria bacterium]MBW1937016.1 hypothetical protein [Deltaproteobacteria bacterium]MBW1937384.1 hypothetical protein [Deltaproteobacteria bacterium]MBW2081259.1 hypothetical protein [Deltaproteobacteria bacterium]MBW2351399.1 hypothetical protein [Deltaproteobacteria bacterium]
MSPFVEQVWIEHRTMEVYCTDHPMAVLRPWLMADGILQARDLRSIPSGQRIKVAGLMIMVHTPPTRSGKRVMFATLEDESGLMDFVMFPGVQKQWAKEVLTNEVLAIEGRLKREGEKGLSISIVAERVLQCFSGPFPLLIKKFQYPPN